MCVLDTLNCANAECSRRAAQARTPRFRGMEKGGAGGVALQEDDEVPDAVRSKLPKTEIKLRK
jgi:hypothetical protein